jgi:hypothetical protein
MGSLFKFNSPMIITPNLPISLLLLITPNLPISLLLLITPNLPISLLLLITPNLPISLLLLRTITMKMLLHHIYFLHPKFYNRCHRLKMARL